MMYVNHPGERQFGPCLGEMKAIEENTPLTCRVEMVDRKVIHFPIEPQSSLEDLTKYITTKTDYSMSEPFSTGLFETKVDCYCQLLFL